MRPILRTFAYASSVVVAIVLTGGGFVYWALSLRAGDPTGQVFGIITGGIFGIMLMCAVLIRAERRKPYPTGRRRRY